MQFPQALALVMPIPVPYVPATQAVHADTPTAEPYVPAVQFRHCRPCTYVPTAQAMHVLPEPSELVPAEQAWQALLAPSTKYWPPPQQTPVPFERQCRVWKALQEAEHDPNPVTDCKKSTRPVNIV